MRERERETLFTVTLYALQPGKIKYIQLSKSICFKFQTLEHVQDPSGEKRRDGVCGGVGGGKERQGWVEGVPCVASLSLCILP